MTQYIIIVTGMREWSDKETICRVLDEELVVFFEYNPHRMQDEVAKDFILRHGVGGNADGFANEWGKERGVTIERFPAQWTRGPGGYNSAAGPIRNKAMAEALPRADKCCAFWDGAMRRHSAQGREFSGTLDMMKVALANGIPLRVEPPKK